MTSNVINALSDSESLTDIMIKMEDFLDSLDLYVYKNWIDGTIVSGPHVTKYWTSMTLLYDYKEMPDPDGALRLMKHGALVKYKKAEQEDNELRGKITTDQIGSMLNNQYSNIDQPGSVNEPPKNITTPLPKKKVWLVEIFIPRRFVDDAYEMDIGIIAADAENKKNNMPAPDPDNTASDDLSGKPATDTSSPMGGNALSEPEDGDM